MVRPKSKPLEGIILRGAGKKLGKLAGNVAKSINPLDVLKEYVDYKKTVQIEDTKRESIRAKRDVAIEMIRSDKEIILEFCSRTFAERRVSLEHFFTMLDDAVKSGSDHQLDAALTGIISIVKTSPFMGFKEFRDNIKRDDFVVEL